MTHSAAVSSDAAVPAVPILDALVRTSAQRSERVVFSKEAHQGLARERAVVPGDGEAHGPVFHYSVPQKRLGCAGDNAET